MAVTLQMDDPMKAVGKGLLLVLTRKLLRLCTDKEKDELEEQAPTSWTKEKLRGMWEAFTATGRCPSPEGSRACLAFSCPAAPQHANSTAESICSLGDPLKRTKKEYY